MDEYEPGEEPVVNDEAAAGEEYVTAADRALEATYEEPMSLAEYIDRTLEAPAIAAHAAK